MPRPQRCHSGQFSCACFDLECSSLDADFGVILCAVVKPAGGKPIIFRGDELNKQWRTKRSDDRGVLVATVNELARHDILVAHNGNRYDIPFLRTRLARWGMDPLPQKKMVDTCQLARNKLKVSYNSLDVVASLLGRNTKTQIDRDMWVRAALDGDTKAMQYIVKHCVEDCYTLEWVVGALKQYSSNLNAWGSAF